MRIEKSRQPLRGSPRKRSRACRSCRSSSGSRTTTAHRPTASTRSWNRRDADRFREANELRAWIEVDDGKIVDAGYSGGALVGSTRVQLGPKSPSFAGVKYPLLQDEPERGPDWVKFVQSAGGRMGLPAPRRVRGKPFFQIASASAWTTLQLIIYADGTAKHKLIGASPFPRHWIYDDAGKLVEKSGEIDFERWWRESFGPNMPWGGKTRRR